MNLTVTRHLENVNTALDDLQSTVDSLSEIRAALEFSGESPETSDNIGSIAIGLSERLATLRDDIRAAITANQADAP